MKRAMKGIIALAAIIIVITAITAIITMLVTHGAEKIIGAVVAIMVGSALTYIFLTVGLLLYRVTTSKE